MLWGDKSVAIFDCWSIEHFLTGMTLGVTVQFIRGNVYKESHEDRIARCIEISLLFAVSFFWEMVEHYLELGLAGQAVQYWFAGEEYWANRIISDPFLVYSGYLVSRYNYLFASRARYFSFLWLFVHIFLFPHSMYLHEII
jgi:hypothetical protein